MRERVIADVGLAIRVAAAGIWLVAGAAKVTELPTFEQQVGNYDLLPHALVAPFAYALPFVELLVGAYLLVGLFVRPAAVLASFLMALFLIAQIQAWSRGLVLDCGCFGSLAHERVGPATVIRDVLLGLPSFALLVWPARRLSLDRRLFAARASQPALFHASQRRE